jgi:mono/diheme cytochrome c family protein
MRFVESKRMTLMKGRLSAAIPLPIFAVAVLAAFAVSPAGKPPATRQAGVTKPAAQQRAPAATADQIAHGKYIVEEVARCPECHTPRDSAGNLDHSRWLQGAPIWITPVQPNSHWADRAPPLAGFPGYTEAQGEQIVEMGRAANGGDIEPPMHTYHLTHADAQAVIAYLRTVRQASQ